MLAWFPVVLAPILGVLGCEQISRSRIWRTVAPLASLTIVPGLLLTPSRPLISPATLLKFAERGGLSPASLQRLKVVYAVYGHRADVFASFRKEWPPDTRIIGLISDGNEPTASWLKPYGSHRCLYLLSEAAVTKAREEGVEYVVLKEPSCLKYFNMDVTRWLEAHQAREIKALEARLVAAQPPVRYTLARFEGRDGTVSIALSALNSYPSQEPNRGAR